MVSDKTNKIYTELIEYIKSIYPDIKSGTTYNENKVEFPYIYFFLVDMPTKLTTLSNTEDGVGLVYQIEVYTDKGADKARKIAYEVRTHMISEGFTCKNFMPVPSATNVSRFVTRFERLDV